MTELAVASKSTSGRALEEGLPGVDPPATCVAFGVELGVRVSVGIGLGARVGAEVGVAVGGRQIASKLVVGGIAPELPYVPAPHAKPTKAPAFTWELLTPAFENLHTSPIQ